MQEAMRDYLAQLMKGIEGEDLMISAIITSVTYVVREFACHCTEELVTSLFECVCEMMVSTSSRDVVLSCLNFVRMFIVTLHSQRLPMYLKRLVCCMSAIDEEFQRSFRIKTRDIYICLMRKCGAELIMKLAPEEDGILLKRLNNIRKAEARKKKQRDQTSQDKDNEEDEEEEVMATQPKTIEHVLADSDDEDDWDEKDVKDPKKRTVKTWIQEDESSIVDFLDPSAAKKVTATNPRLLPQSVEAKKKKQQNMFKTAADGRMIIEEGSDSDSSDESDGGISDAMGSMKVCRKRQLEDTESNLDQEESSFKYQAGGSGIHRPVAAAKEQGAGGAIRKVTKLTAKMRARQSGEKVKNADYGAEFRSSKARGDVKRKGQQHEPFAYVPLSKSVLNKRKVKKQQGQYKSIFAAAKKGAAAGIKQRGKVIAKKE